MKRVLPLLATGLLTLAATLTTTVATAGTTCCTADKGAAKPVEKAKVVTTRAMAKSVARAPDSVPDSKTGQRIVFLGDSITDGHTYPLLVRQALQDAPPEKKKFVPERIVTLGASSTDGHTYQQLVRQAMEEAGKKPPIIINAGVGGNTAAQMNARMERDVLPHRPNLVTLSAGVNDANRKVPLEAYQKEVEGIAAKLRAANVPLMLLTTSILSPKLTEATALVEQYNDFLRRFARENGYLLAEVYQKMQEARVAGMEVLETDGIHPNWEGHRIITRAVLDALGYRDVPVPQELKVELMPGLIREWQIRVAPQSEQGQPVALDEKSVLELKPDATWKKYTLPESAPQPPMHWWWDQERRRGFAMSLDKLIGPGRLYQGVANVESPVERQVYFNTGSSLLTLWLNGQRIYKNDDTHGWHAGRERTAAKLRAGVNTVVIETGPQFFLSITDDNTW